ncbi:MAG: cytochrome c oxidase subunit 3 [Armatimonadota bacterium]|nr:cytochrome c oxidase subunit 3 [Armatimonadota bacterium]MDR7562810.1 cytochrome c oxidase subunit 3 [Armatimonadota bacterium]MDR7568720.1 cytochrome c oxidase subunit 3 [Armatimonadota bacterium]MDR7601733.1 cytochrome c oxidase subunit 3 [Armatimonadota bacterium]
MAEAVRTLERVEAEATNVWAGGVSPFGMSWGKFMMWIFLLSDAFTFGGLLTAYGAVRMSSGVWPNAAEIFRIGFVGTMTFILICSSATMAVAVHAARRGDRRIAESFLLLTILGGLTFLGMQAVEWTHFIREGARLSSNPWGVPAFSASFFIVTGFHGGHVTSGVLYLSFVLLKTRRERRMLEAWERPLRDRAGRRIDPGARVRLLHLPERPELTVEQTHPQWGKAVVLVPEKGPNAADMVPVEWVEVVEEAPIPPVPVDRVAHAERIENAGLYWHFVDLVWVFVFTLMYLVPPAVPAAIPH